MSKPKPGKPKGVLNPKTGKKHFQLFRAVPPPDLRFFVEHFWIVEWDLREGETYRQEVLSYPSVHLVFENENTNIYGVVTGKFTREVSGSGKVLGIKFRPGGFYPFIRTPVSAFSDDMLDPGEIFDVDVPALEKELLALDDKDKMTEHAEKFIRSHLPEKDAQVGQVNTIVDAIISDRTLIKVEQVAERFDMGERSLQRLFNRYVGVSPKWVIKRFRLHEAAGELAENEHINWAKLALDLGYFDQAHFINDFKSIVGQSPAEYVRTIHSKTKTYRPDSGLGRVNH